MAEFSFAGLRRFPDVEAPNLFAADASDRLILDEAAGALASAPPGTVTVIGDRYGALVLGAAALHGATGIRVHQDSWTGERALAENAERLGLTGTYASLPLDASALAGTRVVLLQLPRSLDELDEVAEVVAAQADPRAQVFAGGRVKHMSPAMNDVLRQHFGSVRPRLARQKSRVLIAAEPRIGASGATEAPATTSRWPAREHHRDLDLDLTVVAHGGVFSGTRIDIGTRFLLAHLDRMAPGAARAVDLGCGSGVLAVALARARPDLHVTATDDSAAAVASARATAAVNGLADRIDVVHGNGAASVPDRSVDLVLLNPPFHAGASVTPALARALFADAARVLRPGGELWTVWNSHLAYRPVLERVVGRTRQAGRNAKFTVTVSTRA